MSASGDMSVSGCFGSNTSIIRSIRNKSILARMNEADSGETVNDIHVGDSRTVNSGSSCLGLEGRGNEASTA